MNRFFHGLWSKPRKPRPRPVLGPGGIDVRQRIREMSDQDIAHGADAYFAKFTPDSIQYKKPFSDPEQAVFLTQHLGLLFQAADLFRGARVLDFGCATGWLSLGMAQMGCDVVGIDIAPSAIRLAERLKATRRVPSDGRLEFRAYDGGRLPMGDGTLDRIVCCDTFHHVRDQAHVMREFARVLKDGGRVAFVEPGPDHSKTEASQHEMRLFKVIENDVVMREVAQMAQAAGLRAPQMLVQFQRPVEVAVEDFNNWADAGIPKEQARKLVHTLEDQLTDTQYFYLAKGEPRLDSRRAAGLAAELKLLGVQAADSGDRPTFRFTLRNTGQATWLTERGVHGQVRLGCQLFDGDGNLLNLDHARLDVEPGPVQPGQEVTLAWPLALPSLPTYRLRFDLVAEHVMWFGHRGLVQPVEVPSSDLPR